MSSASRSDGDLVSFVVLCQKRTPYGALGSRALPFPSDLFLYPCIRATCVALLLRCKGGDDFFKARVATKWIPKGEQFQLAVGEPAWRADGDR